MKRTTLAIILLLAVAPLFAQTWDESWYNQPLNPAYASVNPTRLSYNAVRDYSVASAAYSIDRGDFHAIDGCSDDRLMRFSLDGLRQAGKFDLQGSFRYDNRRRHGQSWCSTLGLDADNPFFVCDSIPSDVTVEMFCLSATASYRFSDRLKAGLETGVTTGSRSDQEDPRPATNTSIIPLTAGLMWQASEGLALGFAAKVRFYSSSVQFYNVNPLKNYRYFVMKGMGDFMRRSSSDESGYKRDYDGLTFGGAFQAYMTPKRGSVRDFLELEVSYGTEKAVDGASTYRFLGGDFTKIEAGLSNKLQIRRGGNFHNVSLGASFAAGFGVWSEQQRKLDPEHNNRIYYEVLSTNMIHSSMLIAAGAGYDFECWRDGRRDFYATVDADLQLKRVSQYVGAETPVQQAMMVKAGASACKMFSIGKVLLATQLELRGRMPLATQFASACRYADPDDISVVYSARKFAYETAAYAGAGLMLDASMPMGRMYPGIMIRAGYDKCLDQSQLWPEFATSGLLGLELGAYLKF